MNQFVFEKRQFAGISLDDSMRRRDLSDGCFYLLQKSSVFCNARNISLWVFQTGDGTRHVASVIGDGIHDHGNGFINVFSGARFVLQRTSLTTERFVSIGFQFRSSEV